MGWFDEQNRVRKQKDEALFASAFSDVARGITGRRPTQRMSDAEKRLNAVEEALAFLGVREKCKPAPENLTSDADRLEYVLRPHGVHHRSVTLEKGWYKDAIGPLLARRKSDSSYVALLPGKTNRYRFYDEETGKKCRINAKTAQLFEPEAEYLYKPFPNRALKIRDLMGYMLSLYTFGDIAVYLLCMLAVTLLGLIGPELNRKLFSEVVPSQSTRLLISITVYSVCTMLSSVFMSTVNTLVRSRVNTRQSLAVQSATMMRMLSLSPDFFKSYSSGELSRRISYMNRLCSTLMESVASTGITSLFSLVYVGQIFRFAPSLVLPALVVILVNVTFSAISTLVQMKVTRKAMLLGTKEAGMSYATVTGIQKIKLAGAEKRFFARWAKCYAEGAELNYNPPAFIRLGSVISAAIRLAGTLVLYYAALSSRVNVADYFAFTASYGLVSGAFSSLGSVALIIAEIKPTLEMVKPILETVPETAENKEIVTSLKGSVELDNVTFAYPDGPNVIEDLSLKINPGQYVAICGRTGCGKSTLVRLMLGFEKPQKGTVFFDHKKLERLDMRSLRRRIGTVMQNGKLFMGDIYSNIVISAPELGMEAAWEAAEIADVADDIRAMPMGMYTMISEGQGGISGGQKQRLMIARAIAPKPRILILDEATSALDNVTQKKVSEALDRLKCTRIVIAHRLSTIRHCDRIVYLEGGHIVEDGSYEELMEKRGLFYELVKRQQLETEDNPKGENNI